MHFYKYQGAGNDFVMLDQRQQQPLTRQHTADIAHLCDRRFGIGADGLILLQHHPDYDFEMIYFNADGRESTLCGNGGRCIAAFAKHLGMVQDGCRFVAIDGPHEARLTTRSPGVEWVELHMNDVPAPDPDQGAFVLNTGSPHYVRFVDALADVDVVQAGRAVRYAERFREAGINVNLVRAEADGGLSIRTYERGVEDETLACGTGVTAAALAAHAHRHLPAGPVEVPVQAQGGLLSVRYVAHADGSFTDVWLCGPATRVFEGEIGQAPSGSF